MTLELARRLRTETRSLHADVERSPFMTRLLAGRVDRPTYCLLLRNLHAVYEALERGVHAKAARPALSRLVVADLLRLEALEADLRFLHGATWPHALPVVPAAAAYGGHLDDLASARGHLLAAHAYVRYLGDLAGGQQLRGIVARSLSLDGATGTAFYAFGSAQEVLRLTGEFRVALEGCVENPVQADAIVEEAQLAFRWHQRLFAELDAASREAGGAPVSEG